MDANTPHVRVACYVRSLSLSGPVDSTLRSLDRLESEGVVDEFTVEAWPATVRLDCPTNNAEVVSLFEEFDAWADQWDVSIRPPFAIETRTSEITDDSRALLITPVQCLAVYVDGALAEVFPHTVDRAGDGGIYTVAEALTRLEDHVIQAVAAGASPATPPRERSAEARPVPNPEACPICETRLVSGQGVYACANCDWVGVATSTGRYRSVRLPAESDRWPAPATTDG